MSRNKLFIIAFTAFSLWGAERPAAAQGWSNEFRRTITIDHTKVPNTDQVNFPVLVSGTYSDLATVANGGSVANANGFDIVFTSDPDGSNPLPFEQELYNPSNGTFAYWVQIPTVSHTSDTVFYLFYGNSSITTDQSNKSGVWDSNYKGVWHFNQTPNGTGSEKDSTSNAYHGTPASSGITLSTDGIAGGSLSFDGKSSSNAVTMSSAVPGTAPLTISLWIKTTGENSTAQSSIMNKSTWSSMGWSMADDGQYNSWTLFRTLPNWGNEATISRSLINNGVWHYLVGTLLNGSVSLYLDGALASTQTYNSMTADTTDSMTVGGFGGNAGGGLLTEARISNISRSADWIATEYNNQYSPAFFISIGSAASGPNSPMISSLSPKLADYGDLVTIQGSNLGATQGSSTVSFNGSPLTPQSWSNTAVGVNVPYGAASGPFSVTVGGTTAVSPVLTIRHLPSGWLDADVGSVSQAGSATYANGIFTVTGSGSVGNSADAFHFVYQALSGDGTITARFLNSGPGIMIRETLAASSRYARLHYYAYYGTTYFDNRASTGGGASTTASVGQSSPGWLRLTRSGNTFSAYTASDGVNWSQLGSSVTVSMAQNVYIGLASWDGEDGFDNVSIATPSNPAPVITGLSATTGAIGSQIVISGLNFGAFQGSSLVTLNSIPMTVNSWSATSITVTLSAVAGSGPMLVSVGPSMNDSNYVNFTVTPNPLSDLSGVEPLSHTG